MTTERSPAAAEADAIACAIYALLDARADNASICPSEVARALWPDHWRARMQEVREVARALAARGELRVRQRGLDLDPAGPWRGPIRLAKGRPVGADSFRKKQFSVPRLSQP